MEENCGPKSSGYTPELLVAPSMLFGLKCNPIFIAFNGLPYHVNISHDTTNPKIDSHLPLLKYQPILVKINQNTFPYVSTMI